MNDKVSWEKLKIRRDVINLKKDYLVLKSMMFEEDFDAETADATVDSLKRTIMGLKAKLKNYRR